MMQYRNIQILDSEYPINFLALKPPDTTAPKLHGYPKKISWGPNGDLISSEMGTQWGPSTAEMGTQTTYI